MPNEGAARAFFERIVMSVDAAQRVVTVVPQRWAGLSFALGACALAAAFMPSGHHGSLLGCLGCLVYGLLALLYYALFMSPGTRAMTIDFRARKLTIEPAYGFGRAIEARFEDVTAIALEGEYRTRKGRLVPWIHLTLTLDASTSHASVLFRTQVARSTSTIALVRELGRVLDGARVRECLSDDDERRAELFALEAHAREVGSSDRVLDVARFAFFMMPGIMLAIVHGR